MNAGCKLKFFPISGSSTTASFIKDYFANKKVQAYLEELPMQEAQRAGGT